MQLRALLRLFDVSNVEKKLLLVQPAGSGNWIKAVFDVVKRSLLKTQVEAMFLQAIASGLITTEMIDDNLHFVLAREEVRTYRYPPFCYKKDVYWEGMNLRHPPSKRRYAKDQWDAKVQN